MKKYLYLFLPVLALSSLIGAKHKEFDIAEFFIGPKHVEHKESSKAEFKKLLEFAELKHHIKDSWLEYAQKMHGAKLALKREILREKHALMHRILPKLIESNFSPEALHKALQVKVAFAHANMERWAHLMHGFAKVAKEMHKRQESKLKAFAESLR